MTVWHFRPGQHRVAVTAQPRSGAPVVLLGTLTGLTALSIDMTLPALPTLNAVFGAGADETALTLSMFLAGNALSQLFYGPLADRFGRRLPLLVGLALFAAAGAGCALSGTIGQLILWRLVQGVGACAGPILARAVVRDLYERRRAIQILAYMALVMSLAPLLAPIAGGYLVALHWRAIFALLAVTGLLVLAVVWLALPESVPRRDLSATRPTAVLRHLIDFFGRRVCLGHAVVISFAYCGLYAYISGSPFVLIEVFGVPSDRYGYLFGLNAFAMMAGSLLNTRLIRFAPPATVLRLGLGLIAAGGTAMLACAVFGIAGAFGIVASMQVYMLGIALAMPTAIVTAMEPVPHMAGFASSLIGCLQAAGGSLVGYIVGALYDRTALPMAAAIAVSAALAGIGYFGFLRRLPAG